MKRLLPASIHAVIRNPSRVVRVEGGVFTAFPSSTDEPMHLSYPDLIDEPVSVLADAERAHRGTPLEIRLKMLRLLKEETFRSRSALAPVLGYSKRQLKRWFDAYREGGLEGLLDRGSPGGSTERVTPEAWADLEQKMIAGEIPRLEDARRYLAEKHEVHYGNVTSISSLFQRRDVKLKTGRKQNRKADREAQTAFKKSAQSSDEGRL